MIRAENLVHLFGFKPPHLPTWCLMVVPQVSTESWGSWSWAFQEQDQDPQVSTESSGSWAVQDQVTSLENHAV